MKIAAVVDPIEASGLGAGNTFSIATNSKAFEILSRQIYADPVAAVIREITCNAADAHKLTGRPLSDIEVKLPNLFEPDFWVRDYGPGLSIQDVRGLYTTYFASTKDQSDDMIGGFGVGSKSPFAVADQFTVTSWHAGFCSEFVCYKENGAPRINMIRSTPSVEPTGLKVQVAATDYYPWKHAAEEFFKWWPSIPATLTDIQPIFSSFTHYSAHMEGVLRRWYIQANHPKHYVLMGGVTYEIDTAKIPFLAKLSTGWRDRRHSLVLVAPLGAVSPQPSREQLNYNDFTIAWLNNAASAAITELHNETLTQFKAITSPYEARKFCYEADQNIPFLNILKSQFIFNNEYPGPHVHHAPTTYKVATYTRYSYSSSWRSGSGYLSYSITNADDYKFIYCSAAPTSATYRRIRLAHPTKETHYYHLVWDAPLADIQADLDKAGFPPNCLVEFDVAFPPLPLPPKKPRTTASAPRTLKGYTQRGNYRGTFTETQEVLSLSTPSYWVETQAREITDHAIRQIVEFILNYLPDPVTRINASQLTDRARAQLKKAGWTEITSQFFMNQPISFFDKWYSNQNLASLDSSLSQLINIYYPKLPATSALKQEIAKLLNQHAPSVAFRAPDITSYHQYFSAAQLQHINDNQSAFSTQLAAVKKELAKFPLLPHLQLTNTEVPAILAYLST